MSFGFLLDPSHLRCSGHAVLGEGPMVDTELARGILYPIWPGNTARFPRRCWDEGLLEYPASSMTQSEISGTATERRMLGLCVDSNPFILTEMHEFQSKLIPKPQHSIRCELSVLDTVNPGARIRNASRR